MASPFASPFCDTVTSHVGDGPVTRQLRSEKVPDGFPDLFHFLGVFGGAESMAKKFHGKVHDKVPVNFLALFASKPHIFMCGALKLFRFFRVNVNFNSRIVISGTS